MNSPIGSYQPRLSPAVKILLFSLLGIYVLQMVLTRFAGLPVVSWFGFTPREFWTGHVWQLVTYSFLHGSLTHLLFNAAALYLLGPELERRWGTRRFVKFYLVSAAGGAVLETIVWVAGSLLGFAGAAALGDTPVVGASGALYGLFMAFGYIFGDALVLAFFILPMKARHFVMLLFFIEFMSAVFGSPSEGGGVSHLAHLGGLITAFIYLRLKGKDLKGGGGGFFKRRMGKDEVKRRLSLVVNNDQKPNDGKYPITWN